MPPVHLNLDDSWKVGGDFQSLNLPTWGPRLRYHGQRAEVEQFYQEIHRQLTPFVLYGSGDFHYLAALLLRRVDVPVTVICFDNHPDWDIRPPHWSCGGWVNRALELSQVRRVAVWGCGSFELAWPARLFANHRALRSGRLQVHAWAERQSPSVQSRFSCMNRDDWRGRFQDFVAGLEGQNVYVTVDLDCLRSQEAVTNWEQGLYTAEDVAWALRTLRQRARLIAGDLCGAYSPPSHSRWFQRFAAGWDHPRLPHIELIEARRVNRQALDVIWPALVGEHAG